jgi:hypothetical protein
MKSSNERAVDDREKIPFYFRRRFLLGDLFIEINQVVQC